jgi:DNA repair protein RadB
VYARSQERVITGLNNLDSLLYGGFLMGEVNLIYGEATTGKTTLALTTVFNYLKQHKASDVYIIDSDNKLNTDRLTNIAKSRSLELLKQIHTFTPKDFDEQEQTFENLPKLEKNDIIVVDSITGLYRVETSDEEKTYRTNKELNRQLGYITEIARRTEVAMILTGQVRSILDTNQVEPVASRLLSYWSSLILKLEKMALPDLRQAIIEKPVRYPNSVVLRMSADGFMEDEI